MKKLMILLLVFYCSIYSQDDFATVRVNEMYFGSSFENYDVKVYRSAPDILKTDDNLEILGYLKFKGIQFGTSGDSLVIIDKTVDDTVATRRWVRNNAAVNWDNVSNKPVKLTDFLGSNIAMSGHTINNTSDEIVLNANGSVSFNYNNSSAGILAWYGGGPSATFAVQPNGDTRSYGKFQAVDYYSGDGTQGSTGSVSGLGFKDGLYTGGSLSVSIDWASINNVPPKVINYSNSYLQVRSNVIEENATAGETQLWVNWSGYNSGIAYYRDFAIGDGKNNTVAYFDGNTKEVDFNGNLDLNGNDLTVDDIFADQVNAVRIVSSPGASVDIRPASGQALAVGYNAGGAVDFIHYGGGTSPVFSVQENGAATFAGDVTIPADVYGAGWNGLQEAAPKDAVYDAIEGLTAGGIADGDKGDITVSGTGAIWNIDNGALAFSEISSKPTTLSGYGITDAASSSHSHSFGSLSAIPSTFTPSTHGNGSHSESYITASALNGYATNSYVDAQINNLQNWVISQNYTAQSWVSSQGYASTAQVSYIQGLVIALESRVTSCGCP